MCSNKQLELEEDLLDNKNKKQKRKKLKRESFCVKNVISMIFHFAMIYHSFYICVIFLGCQTSAYVIASSKMKPLNRLNALPVYKNPTPFHDIPIIINNNHKRPSYSPFTRHKLSTEYAFFFTTTPIGSSSTSTRPPTTFYERPSSTYTSSPYSTHTSNYPYSTTTMSTTSNRPQHVTPLSHLSSSIVSVIKRPPIKINHLHGNRLKPQEQINSPGLTVLDSTYVSGTGIRLPPNTTVVHKNVVVPFRPGRPHPPSVTTTQFPVYPVVAGFTNWHLQTPSHPNIIHWQRPSTTTVSTPWTSWTTTIAPPSVSYDTQSSQTSIDSMTTTMQSIDSTDESTQYETNEQSVTSQSIHKPTIITISAPTQQILRPAASSIHPHRFPAQSSQHILTVTPIKNPLSSSQSYPIKTYLVTQTSPTPRPSTSTTGYVNAIWAPPMPSIATYPAPSPTSSSGLMSWLSPLTNLFTIDPSTSSISFLSVMRSVMFTVLVMFLPPLTLAAALMNGAAG